MVARSKSDGVGVVRISRRIPAVRILATDPNALIAIDFRSCAQISFARNSIIMDKKQKQYNGLQSQAQDAGIEPAPPLSNLNTTTN